MNEGLLVVSYPVNEPGHFKVRVGGMDSREIMMTRSLEGTAECIDADNEAGRLYYRAGIVSVENRLTGLHLVLHTDSKASIPENARELSGPSCFRECFRRHVPGAAKGEPGDWRIKNEFPEYKVIEYVQKYKGVMRLAWFDRTSHLYHMGRAFVGEDKVGYFAPSEVYVEEGYNFPPHVKQMINRIDRAAEKAQARGRVLT